MSKQPDDRTPPVTQENDAMRSRPRSGRRTWLADVVGGGVLFGVMFVIDRLRPSRRRRYRVERHGRHGDELSIERVEPDEETVGGGTYETAAGYYAAPPGVHEAPHSAWPVVVAVGIGLALFGIVTSYAFSLFGVVVFVVGVVGWSAELLDE